MVHNKSEYRLQFHRLSNDVRAQIWRENVLFRETQKRMNLSDHYWRYQLIDDMCVCGDSSDLGLQETNSQSSKDVTDYKSGENLPNFSQDKGVQTVDESSRENLKSSAPEKGKENLSDQSNNAPVVVEPPVTHGESAVKIASTSEHFRATSNHSVHTNQTMNTVNRKQSEQNVKFPIEDTVYSSLNPFVTRNVQKSYKSQPNTTPVFAAFGWNDSDKDVGDQKTFNVRAPIDQIHQTALLASGKRLMDLELHFAKQLRKKRMHKSLVAFGPSNLSSIWMTEYQESFSKGQREPLPKSSPRRPIVWRYT